MAQTQRELEDQVGELKWNQTFQTRQLHTFGEMLDDMERGAQTSERNMNHEIYCLKDEVQRLSAQVRDLMRWEPWLLRVYRWWYAMPPPE
jgi:hypothetical protein